MSCCCCWCALSVGCWLLCVPCCVRRCSLCVALCTVVVAGVFLNGVMAVIGAAVVTVVVIAMFPVFVLLSLLLLFGSRCVLFIVCCVCAWCL